MHRSMFEPRGEGGENCRLGPGESGTRKSLPVEKIVVAIVVTITSRMREARPVCKMKTTRCVGTSEDEKIILDFRGDLI